MALAPRFLRGSSGHLFIQMVVPENSRSDAIVIMLPPLFEEMNKSRRMLALQARRFAQKGLMVVTPDLFGLGDSEGSLIDATLEQWREDLARLTQWLAGTYAPSDVHLLTLRSAALLLDLVDYDALPVKSWTLWSPVTRGSRLVRDLYRQALIVARNRGDAQITVAALKEMVSRERRLESSGYEFSRELLDQIESAQIPDAPPKPMEIFWFDVRSTSASDSPTRVPDLVSHWIGSGLKASYQVCEGPPFWQTAEISESPALIEATTATRSLSDK